MTFKKLKDLLFEGIEGRKILVRSDLNVPMNSHGKIVDTNRIVASVPTLETLIKAGAKVIVTAHLGRPVDGLNSNFSLKSVASVLQDKINCHVQIAKDSAGKDALYQATNMKNGSLLLLENIRFNSQETSKKDIERLLLAKKLAYLVKGSNTLPGAFVSDGFGVIHRKQASIYDIANLLPSYAGLLVSNEIKAFKKLIQGYERPFAIVLGGAKITDKLKIIENLVNKVDIVIIGGGMYFTFLAARGISTGNSLLQTEAIENCKYILDNYSDVIHLPIDTIVADKYTANAQINTVDINQIPRGRIGLDIGPKSVKQFSMLLSNAKTIFWNGPMGAYEFTAFSYGTVEIAKAIVNATNKGAFSVVGGGDVVAALSKFGISKCNFSHISTGGGASLKYLEGKILPGIEVLG